jgi:hypothetical protein
VSEPAIEPNLSCERDGHAWERIAQFGADTPVAHVCKRCGARPPVTPEEIIRDIATGYGDDGPMSSTEIGDTECGMCHGTEQMVGVVRPFRWEMVHEPDCPWVRARAWVEANPA